jgi:signal transduction histidine kinase
VYRVVQEALTNTMRHAGPARASVCLDYQPEAVVVTVSDDGRGAAAARPDGEPGHGLAGMRERVTLYGGEMSAGPQAGGGFRVTASLPTTTGAEKPRATDATRATEATRVTGGKIQGWVR